MRHGRPELRWQLLVAPGTEPVTAAEVKEHRRIDPGDTSQDSTIALLITMAREYAESYLGKALVTQKWRVVLDAFPGVVVPPTPFAAVAVWLPTPQPSPAIWLTKGPLQTVDAIKYLDGAGVQQTVPSTDYVVDTSGIQPRISLANGKAWPITLEQIGAVTIDMTLGYGNTATDVPAGIRHWILVRVGTMFENREEVAILSRGKVDPLPFMDGLLDPYKVPVV